MFCFLRKKNCLLYTIVSLIYELMVDWYWDHMWIKASSPRYSNPKYVSLGLARGSNKDIYCKI